MLLLRRRIRRIVRGRGRYVIRARKWRVVDSGRLSEPERSDERSSAMSSFLFRFANTQHQQQTQQHHTTTHSFITQLKGHVWACHGCKEEYNVRRRTAPFAQPGSDPTTTLSSCPNQQLSDWLCPLCEYVQQGDGIDARYVIVPSIRAKMNKKRTKTGYRGVGISEKKGCFTR